MSAVPETIEDGAEPSSTEATFDESAEDAWSCESPKKKVRVRVSEDGELVEIPTVEVETKVSKGLTDRDTLTRVIFPIRWQGYNVATIIDPWVGRHRDTVDGNFDIATVEWRDERTNEWYPVQTGWIRGVGGAPKTGTAKFVIQGFETFLDKIRVSKGFGTGGITGRSGVPSYDDILSFVEQKLNNTNINKKGQQITAELVDNNFDGIQENYNEGGILTGTGKFYNSITRNSIATKKFNSNEHSLKDVLDFYTERLDQEWYFDNVGNLLVVDNPDNSRRNIYQDRVYPLDDPPEAVRVVNVLENDALVEISPVNTIWVEGDTASSVGQATDMLLAPIAYYAPLIDGDGAEEVAARNNRRQTANYPLAVAWYPPLMPNEPTEEDLLAKQPSERQGGIGQNYSTDASDPRKAEDTARKRLKEEIVTIGEGDMMVKGMPRIRPNDKVLAYPVRCNSAVSQDVKPYNVESITHRQKHGKMYKTEIDCTVYVEEDLIRTASTLYEV